MDGYEKIVKVIHDQSKAMIKKTQDQPDTYGKPFIQIGEMTSETTCKIGKLELEKEDLLFADHLMTKLCTEVKGSVNEGSITDSSIYITALKKGDKVAIYKVNEDQYIVLERLVSL